MIKMNIKSILAAALGFGLLAVGCTKEQPTSLDNISLDKTYVSFKTDGGSVDVVIKADEAWAFAKNVKTGTTKDENGKSVDVMSELPTWLKASTLSGEKGETTVTFTAESTLNGREAELKIEVGDKAQFIMVRQGEMTVSEATCAEVIAGPDGKNYRITGVVSGSLNTQYGNYDVVDETGSVYVYGTLDAKGAEKNFLSLGIDLGDVVTVEGPKTTYGSTVELVNVTVIKIVKSLLKTVVSELTVAKEGGEVEASFIVKGENLAFDVPAEYQDWISVIGSTKRNVMDEKGEKVDHVEDVVTLRILPNDGGARTGEVHFASSKGKSTSEATVTISQEGSIVDATAAEINAAEDGPALFHYTGCVRNIAQDVYGNMYVADHTGEVYVYGTLDAEGKTKNFASLGIKVGDIVKIEGAKTSYNGSSQMKNVTVIEHTSVETISIEDFLTKSDDAKVYYKLTGKVSNIVNADYGNFDLVDVDDPNTKIYVYGLLKGWGGESKKFAELGLVEGDTITIVGVHASYKGSAQVGSAFFLEKAAN